MACGKIVFRSTALRRKNGSTGQRRVSRMNIIARLSRLLTRSGRDDDSLEQAMQHAKAKRPEKAIEIYDGLLATSTISNELRSRALFNRALAYSSMKDDTRAQEDLEQLLKMGGLAENVQTAARAQLARVKKRGDR